MRKKREKNIRFFFQWCTYLAPYLLLIRFLSPFSSLSLGLNNSPDAKCKEIRVLKIAIKMREEAACCTVNCAHKLRTVMWTNCAGVSHVAAVKCRGLFASLNAWIKKPVVSLNMTLTKALFLSCLLFFKPIFHGSVNMAGLKKWFRDDFSRVFSQGVFFSSSTVCGPSCSLSRVGITWSALMLFYLR